MKIDRPNDAYSLGHSQCSSQSRSFSKEIGQRLRRVQLFQAETLLTNFKETIFEVF